MADEVKKTCCIYCYETFDAFRVPVSLSCAHIVCRQCFNYLREIGKFCPLHKVKVNLKEIPFEEDILCPVHHFQRNSLNQRTNQLLCEKCEVGNDPVLRGNIKTIKNRCEEKFVLLIEKSKKIMNEIGKDDFANFFEGIPWVQSYQTELYEVFKEFDMNMNKSCEEQISVLEKHYIFIQHPEFRKSQKNEQISSKKAGKSKNFANFSEAKINDPNEIVQPNIIEENEERIISDHDRIAEEIRILNEKGLKAKTFFSQIHVNNECSYKTYFARFKQGQRSHINLKGLGIGSVSSLNEILCIESLFINVADTPYQYNDIIIPHIPGQITFDFILSEKIRVELPQEISIQIIIQGSKNFLFKTPDPSFFSIQDTDNDRYTDLFPILYFLID
jgi:hypothetical protein